jgi:hypothetical protein
MNIAVVRFEVNVLRYFLPYTPGVLGAEEADGRGA